MNVLVQILIAALGGGTLVAIIQAVAQRRHIDAQSQATLASGYGSLTDDLREVLKDRDAELREVKLECEAEKDENHKLRWYVQDLWRYVKRSQEAAIKNGVELPSPPPPPVPISLD